MLAGVAASIVNLLLYALASALGAFPATVLVPAAGAPISAAPIAVSSLAGALGGGLAYAGLRWAFGAARARRGFITTAVVVLVASFVTPLGIPGAPAPMIAALAVMHVVVAAATVVALVRAGRAA
ncbi:MAG: hypothetical protein JNK56_31590 [Myxococcales bacterium]|nr:hypothetical protein [Myxococcales bacterium]